MYEQLSYFQFNVTMLHKKVNQNLPTCKERLVHVK